MSTKSVSRYEKLVTTQVENLYAVCHFNIKHLLLWTTPKTLEPQKRDRLKNYEFEVGYTHEKSNCPVSNTIMPLSALSTMSLPSAQTVVEFTNWIPKIVVQFCCLRLYLGIDNISRRLLQWIARIKNRLKLRPTTRYRTYSNQISTRLIPIR